MVLLLLLLLLGCALILMRGVCCALSGHPVDVFVFRLRAKAKSSFCAGCTCDVKVLCHDVLHMAQLQADTARPFGLLPFAFCASSLVFFWVSGAVVTH